MSSVSGKSPNIRREYPDDVEAIRRVNRRAFGGEAEPALVDRLRDGGWSELSLVAELDGQVVGHILFSPMSIEPDGAQAENPGLEPLPGADSSGARRSRVLALAPLAVLPEYQRSGIGSALTRHGLELLRERGAAAVVVLGDPAYYGRFGFSAATAGRLSSPYACDAFMALELVPGGLPAGRALHAPPFAEL